MYQNQTTDLWLLPLDVKHKQHKNTSLLLLGFSLHVSDFTHQPIIERETFENP